MKNPFRQIAASVAESFSGVRGNARAVVATHGFWTVSFNLYSPFLTQYMLNLGCSKADVGVVNAIGMVTGGVIALFAGWLTDRLGRRRSDLIADMISWAGACLIWGLARDFAWFVAASVANSFVRWISVSWNCTLAEGTPPDKRINVYWWLSIISTLSAFLTPLTGLLVGGSDPDRLVQVMRWVFLTSSGVLAVSFFVRNRMLEETPIGIERMQASRSESPLAALKAYAPLLRMVLRSPLLLTFFLIRSLYYVQMNVRGTFFSVAAIQGLGFEYGILGVVNLVAGLAMLPTQLILLPKLRAVPGKRTLAISLTAMMLSTVLLALAPEQNLFVLLPSIVVTAVGGAAAGMLVDAETANAMPDDCRAPLLGMMTVLLVAMSAVFQIAGGWLAEIPAIGPRLPMGLAAVLFAVCLALLGVGAVRRKRRMARPDKGN